MKPLRGDLNTTILNERQASTEYLIAMVIFKSICIILGVSGNLLVIIYNALRYEKDPSTYLCINLGVADLVACLTVYPTRIAKSIHSLTGHISTRQNTAICKFSYFTGCFSLSLSVLTLLAVTYNRYLFIKRPLKYPILMTKRKVYGIIFVLWTVSLIYLPLAVSYVETSHKRQENGCSFEALGLSLLLLTYTYLPIIFILLFNYKIYDIAREQRRSIARNSVRDASIKKENIATRIAKELKAAKTFAVIMGSLLFSYTPFAVIVCFDIVGFDPRFPPFVYGVIVDIIAINSVFNPVIYTIRHKEYRKAIRNYFSTLSC